MSILIGFATRVPADAIRPHDERATCLTISCARMTESCNVGGLAKTPSDAMRDALRRPAMSNTHDAGTDTTLAAATAMPRIRAGEYHGRRLVRTCLLRRDVESGIINRYHNVANSLAPMFIFPPSSRMNAVATRAIADDCDDGFRPGANRADGVDEEMKDDGTTARVRAAIRRVSNSIFLVPAEKRWEERKRDEIWVVWSTKWGGCDCVDDRGGEEMTRQKVTTNRRRRG